MAFRVLRTLSAAAPSVALRPLRQAVVRAAVVAAPGISHRTFRSSAFVSGRETFLERLQYEIEDEATNGEQPVIPASIGDFTLDEHTVGAANISMSAQTEGKTVVVSLDMNECSNAEGLFGEEEEEAEEELNTGKEPKFTVTITDNSSGDAMIVRCDAGLDQSEPGEDEVYVILTNEVGIVPKGTAEEAVYFSDPNYWDDELETSMREYLASLGIDDEFVESLCHYVVDKEYADYTDLLSKMESFVR